MAVRERTRRRIDRRAGWIPAAVLLACGVARGEGAADERGQDAGPLPSDGPAYRIDRFELDYIQVHEQQPPLEEVAMVEVVLGRTDVGYVSPRDGIEIVRRRVVDLGGTVDTYHASAVQAVIVAILRSFTDREYMGVYVAPHPDDITATGEDRRPPGQTALRLLITTGVVNELRTLASGDRIPDEERIDNPLHQRIRNRSPLQPYRQGVGREGDLLQRAKLDRYLFFLSRHPGRRVDAAVSPAGTAPGSVVLDYIVTENRPLIVYGQVGNTGTKQTRRWRERFGLVHTQFTNHDDILSLDFATAGFEDTHTVVGSYERPFAGNDRLRWNVHGLWDEFAADQVGFSNAAFTGTTWRAGAELIATLHQDRETFVDFVVGGRYLDVEVDNPFAGEGHVSYFVPHVGLRLDRTTEWFSTRGAITLEFGIEDDVSSTDLARLGRTSPDSDWTLLRGDLRHSVFLEPLLDRDAWEDPSTPETSTLAHELVVTLRGQYAFDNRLVPTVEAVLGGLYTVRGYRESAVAGDSMLLGNLEYRYHLPRDLAIQAEPRELFGEPFRVAPQQVYGHPDWDLILKAFLDVGRVWNSDRLSFESDETLVGAGVGVEMQLKRNVNLRLDWGFVLEDVERAGAEAGDSRLHFLATIVF